MDPYDVLGLPHGASYQEAKMTYIKLAKKHHPDKLPKHLSEGEYEAHDAAFKKYTEAYRTIEGWEKRGTSNVQDTDWASLWRQVFKDTVTELQKRYHVINVPVTLEDVHNKIGKKLELFLNGIDDPIYLRVNCGLFPKTKIVFNGHIIRVKFILQQHDVYHLDDVLGTNDLYTNCEVSLQEYVTGASLTLRYMDSTDIDVKVPPFAKIEVPLVFSGKGLWEIGDLYIKVNIVLPDQNSWNTKQNDERQKILDALDALYAHGTGAPSTKVFKNKKTI